MTKYPRWLLKVTIKNSDANANASGKRFIECTEYLSSEEKAQARKKEIIASAEHCGNTANVSGPFEEDIIISLDDLFGI